MGITVVRLTRFMQRKRHKRRYQAAAGQASQDRLGR
jgi:hypothetical protein